MKDIEIKEIIDSLYGKSLLFKQSESKPLIRLIQATKSLIGINIGNPLLNLLEYSTECINRIDESKLQQQDKKFDLPEVVSYKNLEESLLNKNKLKAIGALDALCKVSDGRQIVEYLLQFSLKYCKKSYLLIWSVYKMMLFLNNKYIEDSLRLIIWDILDQDIAPQIEDKAVSKMEITQYQWSIDDFEEFGILFSIFNENLIRKDFIRNKCYKRIIQLSKQNIQNIKLKHSVDQIQKGRIWIHNYIQKIDSDNLNNNLILNLDAARSMIKIAEENNMNLEWAWHNINNTLK